MFGQERGLVGRVLDLSERRVDLVVEHVEAVVDEPRELGYDAVEALGLVFAQELEAEIKALCRPFRMQSRSIGNIVKKVSVNSKKMYRYIDAQVVEQEALLFVDKGRLNLLLPHWSLLNVVRAKQTRKK